MSGAVMGKPHILLTAPIDVAPPGGFEADFTVHRFWDMPAHDPRWAEISPHVQAIAAAGRVRIDAALLDRFPAVRAVANFGAGYDRVDVAAVTARGIALSNTPDVLTDEVADLAMGLLVATVRRIVQADAFVRSGGWTKGAFALSPSLRGRRVGILGLGRIGLAIARRCQAFGLEVVYHSRREKPESGLRFFPDLEEMAREVEVLMVCAAGGDDSRALVHAGVLRALGPNGVLINVARGSVVDQDALIEALASGTILAAGLDVFADEPQVPPALLTLENTVLLPHVGSASVPTRQAMGQLVLDNLRNWFHHGVLLTPVTEI